MENTTITLLWSLFTDEPMMCGTYCTHCSSCNDWFLYLFFSINHQLLYAFVVSDMVDQLLWSLLALKHKTEIYHTGPKTFPMSMIHWWLGIYCPAITGISHSQLTLAIMEKKMCYWGTKERRWVQRPSRVPDGRLALWYNVFLMRRLISPLIQLL